MRSRSTKRCDTLHTSCTHTHLCIKAPLHLWPHLLTLSLPPLPSLYCPQERVLCSTERYLPAQYLAVKAAALRLQEQQGSVSRADMQVGGGGAFGVGGWELLGGALGGDVDTTAADQGRYRTPIPPPAPAAAALRPPHPQTTSSLILVLQGMPFHVDPQRMQRLHDFLAGQGWVTSPGAPQQQAAAAAVR